MMPSKQAAPELSDEDLRELIALIDDADSVELKLTVPDEDRRSTVVALDLDPLEAQIRQVYFFDTADLALNRAGIVTRARRSQGRSDDSVVKLRPVVPSELPAGTRESKGFGVEVDAMPGGFVCSGSFKGEAEGVREAAAGKRPLRKLFSKGQRAFFAEHSPEGIELDDLDVLGPVTVFKLKHRSADFDQKLVVELWFYPDGSRILELSTKCPPRDAFDVAARSRAYLAERGINLLGKQETKTRTALEYFAGGLRSPAAASS
jgi:hypothetical protein